MQNEELDILEIATEEEVAEVVAELDGDDAVVEETEPEEEEEGDVEEDEADEVADEEPAEEGEN